MKKVRHGLIHDLLGLFARAALRTACDGRVIDGSLLPVLIDCQRCVLCYL